MGGTSIYKNRFPISGNIMSSLQLTCSIFTETHIFKNSFGLYMQGNIAKRNIFAWAFLFGSEPEVKGKNVIFSSEKSNSVT